MIKPAPITFGGILQPFNGPLGNGDGVVTTDLTTPVSARYVRFRPQEPVRQEEINICMRVGVESCGNGMYRRTE